MNACHSRKAGARGGNGRCVRARAAFSLLEVVVAVGVVALGIVVTIGLFASLARTVGGNAEAEAAAHLGDALRLELTARVRATGSFAPVSALLRNSVAADGFDPRGDAQLLFANRAGTKIGPYDGAIWNAAKEERFFEIALLRNETLSPVAADESALALAYTARIRWPARRNEGAPSQPDDREELLLNGAVSR